MNCRNADNVILAQGRKTQIQKSWCEAVELSILTIFNQIAQRDKCVGVPLNHAEFKASNLAQPSQRQTMLGPSNGFKHDERVFYRIDKSRVAPPVWIIAVNMPGIGPNICPGIGSGIGPKIGQIIITGLGWQIRSYNFGFRLTHKVNGLQNIFIGYFISY